MGVSKAGPAALGMSKQGMSIDEILRRIGWTESRTSDRGQEVPNSTLLISVASSIASRSASRASSSGVSVGNTITIASSSTSISQIDSVDQEEEQPGLPSVVFAEATSDYWEPWDWSTHTSCPSTSTSPFVPMYMVQTLPPNLPSIAATSYWIVNFLILVSHLQKGPSNWSSHLCKATSQT
jgi:hypothetical protein